MTPRRKRLLAQLFAVAYVSGLGLLVWHHWPLVPLVYSRMAHTRPSPAALRYQLANDSSPVVRALSRGRIYEGQPVADVVERYGPFDIETVGRHQTLSTPRRGGLGLTFEGYGMQARDGRLVTAEWFTCTGHLTFFDTLTPDEREEANRAYREYRDRLSEDRQRPYMAVAGAAVFHAQWPASEYRCGGERAAGIAIAGVAGWAAYHEPPYSPEPTP